MILSFKNNETQLIWEGKVSRKLPIEIQKTARRKLRMIHNSFSLNDLRVPPGNRLEKLEDDLAGFFSIRINKQWRIIFQWDEGNAFQVMITDYH